MCGSYLCGYFLRRNILCFLSKYPSLTSSAILFPSNSFPNLISLLILCNNEIFFLQRYVCSFENDEEPINFFPRSFISGTERNKRKPTTTVCLIITEHCRTAADSHVFKKSEREKKGERDGENNKQTSNQIMTVRFKSIFYFIEDNGWPASALSTFKKYTILGQDNHLYPKNWQKEVRHIKCREM